jgi:hypothetical protein
MVCNKCIASAKFTKENVVELWQYLLSNKAIKVNVNTPSYQSKEPTKNNNGYIVDGFMSSNSLPSLTCKGYIFLLFGKISLNSDIDFLNKPTYLLTIS